MISPKNTCLKLEIPQRSVVKPEPIFVKGTWHPTHFDNSITDGLQAWTCYATEEEVKDMASNWDQTVSDYIYLSERCLGNQQSGSVYGFSDAGSGSERLSLTFEKEGAKLEWRWKCQPSTNSKLTIAQVMDFLMDVNIKLSEEVVWKTESFDRLKLEAKKCLAQIEKFSSEKTEFESEIHGEFVNVLNSKKAKLRELRNRVSSKQQKAAHDDPLPEEEEEESTDKTESFDESIGEEAEKDSGGTSSKHDDDHDGVSTSNKTRGKRKKSGMNPHRLIIRTLQPAIPLK